MKKILFLITLVLAIGLISGSKKPVQNNSAEKGAKKAMVNTPRIMFLLSNDKKFNGSQWWKYDPATAGQKGC